MATELCLYSTQIEDYLGVSTTHDIFLNVADTVTLATIVSTMQGYQALLDDMTGGAQRKATLRMNIPVAGGNRTVPEDGDETEMTGLFNFSQVGSTYKNGIDVPALNGLLVVNGRIDLTNAAVGSWVTWLTSAHTNITPTSKFQLDFVGLLDALISFRKHRKSQTRRSIEVGS